MEPKVFISSTYHDLIPFREELRRNLSELDIEILGMEKFGARKNKPLDTCLEEVNKSNIYVGIIAYRYGSVEKGTGKSFTQLEYEEAIKSGKEILIYLFDEEGSILPKFIDFGEKANKLISFKNYLKESHTIDTFKTPIELSKKVNEKLKLLIPSLPNYIVRPQVINAEINRIKIDKEDWLIIVGILNGNPYEIYSVISEGDVFPIPQAITNGKIIEVTNEYGTRYDFSYVDKYGYTNTLGGLNYIFNKEVHNNSKIINSLLKKEFSLNSIKEIIEYMDISSFKDTSVWKLGVLNALKKAVANSR